MSGISKRLIVGLTVATATLLGLPATSSAIVGGIRDCATNQLHHPGAGCSYPAVGAMVIKNVARDRLGLACTLRLIYNEPDKAVILTAAHCAQALDLGRGDGVTFDSQVVDDSVTPYLLNVLLPERVITPDRVILHPRANTEVRGNAQSYVANDMALLIVEDPQRLDRLNALWGLPHGRLVRLAPERYLDSLNPSEFRNLPIRDVGYGADWIDYTNPSGPGNVGGFGNAGFRTVANLTPTGRSADRIITVQNQQRDLEGICYADSGSSAFAMDEMTGQTTILAMPTWVDDNGSKCQATVQWVRLDTSNALSFLTCAFATGDAQAVRSCVDTAFTSES